MVPEFATGPGDDMGADVGMGAGRGIGGGAGSAPLLPAPGARAPAGGLGGAQNEVAVAWSTTVTPREADEPKRGMRGLSWVITTERVSQSGRALTAVETRAFLIEREVLRVIPRIDARVVLHAATVARFRNPRQLFTADLIEPLREILIVDSRRPAAWFPASVTVGFSWFYLALLALQVWPDLRTVYRYKGPGEAPCCMGRR